MYDSALQRFTIFSVVIALCGALGCSDTEPATVHRFATGDFEQYNSYIVETESGVVVIDALLTVSMGRALRERVESIGKPLLAVLVTHGHPDHYNGVTELVNGRAVDIIATERVLADIEAADAMLEAQWEPIFGSQWPETRTFPNRTVEDGTELEFDGARFTAQEIGTGEAETDTYWVLEADTNVAFVGDVVYNQVHSFLAQGHTLEWLAYLRTLKEELIAQDVETLFPGHGPQGDLSLVDDQVAYIELFHETVRELAQGEPTLDDAQIGQLVQIMRTHLDTEALEFMIAVAAPVVALELSQE